MKVLGIIAEYNPFHNGHLYHLEQSKKLCGECAVICVMSGNFIQRGEPAIVDKWARAEAALHSGIDLVVELPVVYAMSSAEYFSYASVRLLDSLGIVDYLCFGSETGNMEELNIAASLLSEEPEEYRACLRQYLDLGLSFPSARARAVGSYLGKRGRSAEAFDRLLSSSNCILGIEYLKALKKTGSGIIPLTILRTGGSYNSGKLEGPLSSATSIRNLLRRWGKESFGEALSELVPPPTTSILKREFEKGRGPVFPEAFSCMILSAVRRSSPGELARLPYVAEGLENRIYEAALNTGTLEELIEEAATKRYARTRLQRILFHLLTGLKAEDFERFNRCGGPQYVRVLGFNKTGRRLLSELGKTSGLPVVTKTADHIASGSPMIEAMLKIEAAATDNYVLGYGSSGERRGGEEFKRKPVIIR